MIDVIEVQTPHELQECLKIREEVFVREQGVPAEEEIDALDSAVDTIHLLVLHRGKPIGTARILFDSPGHCHIGRVALLKETRGSGAGKVLMERACEVALERFGQSEERGCSCEQDEEQEGAAALAPGNTDANSRVKASAVPHRKGHEKRYGKRVVIALSAQEQVIGFYQSCGFSLLSAQRYLDAGIWHRDMEMTMTSRNVILTK